MKETLPPSTLRSLRGRRLRALSGGRDGVALLVVLAFIILLSILVASFLSFSGLDRLSTASYSKSIQAQEVAQGGLQDIIADLHQEIVAGSINPTSATYTQGSTTIYVPATNYTAQPLRLGYPASSWGTDISTTTLPPTLVRVSRASSDGTLTDFNPALTSTTATYYQGGKLPLNRASASSSATPSVNGRYISSTVWNKPGLLAAPGQAVPSDFTGAPPDWVYVTRAGSGAFSSATGLTPSTTLNTVPTPTADQPLPASPVTGRYAYVIYDEGALLDANVAGYPAAAATTTASYTSSSTTAPPNSQVVRGKSYSTYADLTQLPGFSSNAGFVDNLVNWRDAGGLAYAALPANGTGTSFLGAVLNYAQNGFLQFASLGGAGTATDSPFLNRQDLLNYFANPSNSAAAAAVPYLGTYSRAVSAPSWTPSTNAPSAGIYNYASNAEITTATPFSSTSPNPNRDMANVRFPAAGTVTHYFDDPTATTPYQNYTVETGTPLLQNRFSLAKINWLSQADPVAGTAPSSTYVNAIRSCFGLVWGAPGSTTTNSNKNASTAANGGNPCWNYVGSQAGPNSNAAAFNGTIETLDEVAKENREPNFFELLKAAILNGSLGLNPGKALFNNVSDPQSASSGADGPWDIRNASNTDRVGAGGRFSQYFNPTGSSGLVPTKVPDMQIMKIGADIIDQYDSDSYPTAIYFQYANPDNNAYDPVNSTSANGNPILGPVTMVYGDENLPLLNEFYYQVCSPQRSGSGDPTNSSDNTTTIMEGWMQPEIWNPHQAPNANATGNSPTYFQIRAYGQANAYIEGGSSGPGVYYRTNTNSENVPRATINFWQSTAGGLASFYPTPLLLTSDTITGITATSPYLTPDSGDVAVSTFPYYSDPGFGNNHFVGVTTGLYYQYSIPTTAGSSWGGTTSGPLFSPDISFALGWTKNQNSTDPTDFHPFSFVSGMFAYSWLTLYSDPGHPVDERVGAVNQTFPGSSGEEGVLFWGLADPRTERFSNFLRWFGNDGPGLTANGIGGTLFASSESGTSVATSDGGVSGVPSTGNFTSPYGTAETLSYFPQYWDVNSNNPALPTYAQTSTRRGATYYSDLDGIIRPGDGINSQTATGDGNMLITANGIPAQNGGPATAATDSGNVQHARRPVILNRPFRSVAELGYAFRDQPYKTLDFFTPTSADAALLDVFSLTDEAKVSSDASPVINSVTAGQWNPSNACLPVLQAVLSGGSKKEIDPTYNLSTAQATSIAQNIATQLNPTAGANPILNRADLVTRLSTSLQAAFVSSPETANKAYLESPVRALGDTVNSRTWDLLIDIIAQSGHLTSTATSLDQFSVEGERRYWLHLALDRYTGKIISQQLEPVYE